MMTENEDMRIRSMRKRLRVTFPDGKAICHKTAQLTMVDALREIGEDRFPDIDLMLGETRLVTRDRHNKYEKYMVEIGNGWYLNCQSDTRQKCMQLQAISKKLGMNFKVELGDFDTDDVSAKKGFKRNNRLMVKFPDGEYVAEVSPQDTFLQCVFKIGVDALKRKQLEWAGKPLISSFQQYNNQVQVGVGQWLYVPGTIRDKVKMLKVIGAVLHLKLEVTMI